MPIVHTRDHRAQPKPRMHPANLARRARSTHQDAGAELAAIHEHEVHKRSLTRSVGGHGVVADGTETSMYFAVWARTTAPPLGILAHLDELKLLLRNIGEVRPLGGLDFLLTIAFRAHR